MTPDLTLLDGVRWKGQPLTGDRPAALLAALALHPTGLSDSALADQVWTDRPPDHPAKALQVVVSRVRNSCGAELIKRYDGGYRLALPRAAVDAWAVEDLVDSAGRDLAAGQLSRAKSGAEGALDLLKGLSGGASETGPLGDVRDEGLGHRRTAEVTLGLAMSGASEDVAAMPYLVSAHRAAPDDEAILAALLKSEAKAIGPAAALSRYEDYRVGLRDRLGTDPGEGLRRIHRELLAADHPLHTGLHFDGTELLGRDDDLRQLKTLVRTGRVTSIVGPGGLGKTRLAHVLARDAEQSRVHFVELVGVTSPDDVVAEVGAALGVRDSVAGRRDLTAAQRADIRGRIAQQLDTAPTLLVLDNCEHLVEAVASLVAFLVVTTRELHVVTTTRSPLNIAAERVFLLAQLGERDSAELFCRRATAARPDVRLDEEAVASVVRRLDGLPLAIELAAARTRVMSVDEISRRLQDRFSLLRGRDHTAPDRHQTLQAVIDWSWNLLEPVDQRALCWLSVFHDGFGMAAAERLIGDQAMASVETLVDQSLLTVSETQGRIRYRMLETVREFGRMHLDRTGERESASAAQTAWAQELCSELVPRVYGPDQIDVIDELRVEEANLADVLRQGLSANDSPTVAVLLSALGIYWSITGNHGRIIVLADAAQGVLCDWEPTAEQVEFARTALALLISNTGLALGQDITQLAEALRRLGPGEEPFVVAAHALHLDGAAGFPRSSKIEELTAHPDRQVRIIAKMWACVLIENDGDPYAARVHALEAIAMCRDSDGPWQRALLLNQLAGLELQLGHHAEAAARAREALPTLLRLNAIDDAMHMTATLALHALAEGRLDDAEAALGEITRDGDQSAVISGRSIVMASYAELSLVRGQVDEGLRQYDEAVEAMRDIHFPGMEASGLEPWTIFIESVSVVAAARHATRPEVVEAAKERRDDVLRRASTLLQEMPSFVDYPVTGLALVAVASWGILRGGAPGPEDSVRLLALAKRFAYNQSLPTVSWDLLVAEADAIRPGLVAELLEEYGDRTGPDLVDEALKVFGRAQ